MPIIVKMEAQPLSWPGFSIIDPPNPLLTDPGFLIFWLTTPTLKTVQALGR